VEIDEQGDGPADLLAQGVGELVGFHASRQAERSDAGRPRPAAIVVAAATVETDYVRHASLPLMRSRPIGVRGA
jgi:hypothetical protein